MSRKRCLLGTLCLLSSIGSSQSRQRRVQKGTRLKGSSTLPEISTLRGSSTATAASNIFGKKNEKSKIAIKGTKVNDVPETRIADDTAGDDDDGFDFDAAFRAIDVENLLPGIQDPEQLVSTSDVSPFQFNFGSLINPLRSSVQQKSSKEKKNKQSDEAGPFTFASEAFPLKSVKAKGKSSSSSSKKKKSNKKSPDFDLTLSPSFNFDLTLSPSFNFDLTLSPSFNFFDDAFFDLPSSSSSSSSSKRKKRPSKGKMGSKKKGGKGKGKGKGIDFGTFGPTISSAPFSSSSKSTSKSKMGTSKSSKKNMGGKKSPKRSKKRDTPSPSVVDTVTFVPTVSLIPTVTPVPTITPVPTVAPSSAIPSVIQPSVSPSLVNSTTVPTTIVPTISSQPSTNDTDNQVDLTPVSIRFVPVPGQADDADFIEAGAVICDFVRAGFEGQFTLTEPFIILDDLVCEVASFSNSPTEIDFNLTAIFSPESTEALPNTTILDTIFLALFEEPLVDSLESGFADQLTEGNPLESATSFTPVVNTASQRRRIQETPTSYAVIYPCSGIWYGTASFVLGILLAWV